MSNVATWSDIEIQDKKTLKENYYPYILKTKRNVLKNPFKHTLVQVCLSFTQKKLIPVLIMH